MAKEFSEEFKAHMGRDIPYETRSIGGKHSQENKKKKKTLAMLVDRALDAEVTDEALLALMQKSGFPIPKKPKYKDFLISQVLSQSAKRGKPEELMALAEFIGEFSPKKEIELSTKDEININITGEDEDKS